MSADTTNGAANPNVFTIELGCSNCGDTFERSYPAKTAVSDDTDGVRASGPDADFGDNRIICETCEMSKHLGVDDRWPIENDNNEQ